MMVKDYNDTICSIVNSSGGEVMLNSVALRERNLRQSCHGNTPVMLPINMLFHESFATESLLHYYISSQ